MLLERFGVPGLGHYSYLFGTKGKAVVVDPNRDVDRYLKYAEAHGLLIIHVLETHIHADYASGARQLAEATNAETWLSGHDHGEESQYRFAHHEFRDGEELPIGDLRIAAVLGDDAKRKLAGALYDSAHSRSLQHWSRAKSFDVGRLDCALRPSDHPYG